jgi:hypothetical protein
VINVSITAKSPAALAGMWEHLREHTGTVDIVGEDMFIEVDLTTEPDEPAHTGEGLKEEPEPDPAVCDETTWIDGLGMATCSLPSDHPGAHQDDERHAHLPHGDDGDHVEPQPAEPAAEVTPAEAGEGDRADEEPKAIAFPPGSISARVLTLLDGDPGREFTASAVHEHVGGSYGGVTGTLSTLASAGQIRKVTRGVYRSATRADGGA